MKVYCEICGALVEERPTVYVGYKKYINLCIWCYNDNIEIIDNPKELRKLITKNETFKY